MQIFLKLYVFERANIISQNFIVADKASYDSFTTSVTQNYFVGFARADPTDGKVNMMKIVRRGALIF